MRHWTSGAGLLALIACGTADGGGQGEVTRRDSAGIAIVENAGSVWAEGEGWTLDAEPLVQIGGDAGDRLYDLGRISGAVQLADGAIAVTNGATNEIRIYGPDGIHRVSTGRTGGGPGEYQMVMGMWRTPADSLMVLDMMARRLTVLGPDGGLGRSYSLGGMGGSLAPTDGNIAFAIPAGVLDDGSMIGLAQAFQINDAREGAYRDTVPAVLFGPDGAVVDTIGRFPGTDLEQITLSFGPQSMKIPIAVMLGRQSVALATARQFYIATNDAWEVQVRDVRGRLQSLIRVASAPRRLSAAEIAASRAEQIELMDNQSPIAIPPVIRDQMVARMNAAPYPETLPFVALMLADRSGHLWVQEVSRPGDHRARFAVFDPTGRLLGWVRMPEKFRPTDITDATVVGIWQDPDDVEHIRVYRLQRGG